MVEWFKPKKGPNWAPAAQYATLPESLVVRELRYPVGRPGFRTQEVTLVTTLLDADLYPLLDLAELYRQRWQGVPSARLSFIDALRWLRSAKAGEALGKIVVNPNRPDRVEPRVVKRRPKEYDRMTQPRAELRKKLLGASAAA